MDTHGEWTLDTSEATVPVTVTAPCVTLVTATGVTDGNEQPPPNADVLYHAHGDTPHLHSVPMMRSDVTVTQDGSDGRNLNDGTRPRSTAISRCCNNNLTVLLTVHPITRILSRGHSMRNGGRQP